MTGKKGKNDGSDPGEKVSCKCDQNRGCRVEAVLTIDERGQMVLPKDVRERAGIRTGEKLALISWERDGRICCLALIKSDDLSGMIKDVLDPLMQGPEVEVHD
jgi:antitoxin PrlF